MAEVDAISGDLRADERRPSAPLALPSPASTTPRRPRAIADDASPFEDPYRRTRQVPARAYGLIGTGVFVLLVGIAVLNDKGLVDDLRQIVVATTSFVTPGPNGPVQSGHVQQARLLIPEAPPAPQPAAAAPEI
ncbi:MAG: hypothetical protein FJX57_21610, partial [Alphaproteobacteria bacterium]|nr:hypothetical protein [Alphaproteobacteria bacterium]